MEATVTQIGQKADIHLLEFYPAIARERHLVPFRTRRFALPEPNLFHAVDCILATRQQKKVRRLQKQLLAAGMLKAGEPRDETLIAKRREAAETLQGRYWKAADSLAIRRDRIFGRLARHQPA